MDDLTIVCWKWKGWRENDFYTANHVNALAKMLDTYVKRPYRLVCITDDPEGITECETYPMWEDTTRINTNGKPNCYRRLKIFSAEMKDIFGPRIASIDLDTVIFKDITDVFDTDSDFKIMKGTVSKYNGSFFLHSAGKYTMLWDKLSRHAPELAERYAKKHSIQNVGSDQSWLSMKVEDADVWTQKDGLHFMNQVFYKGYNDKMRMIFFPGRLKPWYEVVKREWPEAYDQYMRFYSDDSSNNDNEA